MAEASRGASPSLTGARAAGPEAETGNAWTRLRARPWWPWLSRGVTLAFFGLVAWLIVAQARTVAWGEVMQSVAATPVHLLMGAAVLALLTYGAYGTFDLIGRYCARHHLGIGTVLGFGFISYAFTLNLGTLVGGVAFRYRLYSRLGVEPAKIAHIAVLSMLTNWIGYCLLAGLLFGFWPPELPKQWGIDDGELQVIGLCLVLVALAYVVLCAVRRGRGLVIRGNDMPLPTWPVALVQLALSSAHWTMMGGIIFVLMQGRVGFPEVLATLLVAAIAGVIAHVPGGLGVLETVFVGVLSHQASRNDILAALIGYRAVYYLAPLLIAAVAYFVIELRLRSAADGRTDGPRPAPAAA